MCHPTFATNPSGTDINTINIEGDERNHFVSLIVSNTCPYSARITRKIKKDIKLTSTEEWSYRSWNNELVEFEPFTEETAETKYLIECYPLDIEVEDVDTERDELQVRMDELDNSSKSYANRANSYGFSSNKYGYPMSPISSAPSYQNTSMKFSDGSEAKQLTLWSEDYKKDDANVIDNEISTVESLIEKHFNLIVTGDIFGTLKVKNPKTPNYLDNYIKNMEALYKKRFDYIGDFHLYAESILEYCYEEMIDNTYNIAATKEELLENHSIEFITAWASGLSAKLTELDNPYSKYFIQKLTQYA